MNSSENLPVVAIVGRPNVGKSTLFNRLSRARRGIVNDQPGVTRDRNYNAVSWRRHRFVLVDTGGMEPDEREGLKGRILQQTMIAVAEADVIVFLLDGRTGPMPPDTAAVGASAAGLQARVLRGEQAGHRTARKAISTSSTGWGSNGSIRFRRSTGSGSRT